MGCLEQVLVTFFSLPAKLGDFSGNFIETCNKKVLVNFLINVFVCGNTYGAKALLQC